MVENDENVPRPTFFQALSDYELAHRDWVSKALGVLGLFLGIAMLGLGVTIALSGMSFMREAHLQPAVVDFMAGGLFAIAGVVDVVVAIAMLRRPERTLMYIGVFYIPVLVCTAAIPVLTAVSDLRTLLVIGVLIVVTLGATGLVLRAIGELRGAADAKSAARWKAAGYLVGACAYVVTASVSLIGAAHLFPSQ